MQVLPASTCAHEGHVELVQLVGRHHARPHHALPTSPSHGHDNNSQHEWLCHIQDPL